MNAKMGGRQDAVDQLINRGKWQEALRLALLNSQDSELGGQARTWFQLALAYRLLLQGQEADRAHQKARATVGYDACLEGDFLRDRAIMLIKLGELETARWCLWDAWQLHQGDRNRLACLKMVGGRYSMKAGKADEARRQHRAADKDFAELGKEANAQWRINNRLHWLVALRHDGYCREALPVLIQLLKTDRWQRKVAGVMVYFGGRHGVRYVLRRY